MALSISSESSKHNYVPTRWILSNCVYCYIQFLFYFIVEIERKENINQNSWHHEWRKKKGKILVKGNRHIHSLLAASRYIYILSLIPYRSSNGIRILLRTHRRNEIISRLCMSSLLNSLSNQVNKNKQLAYYFHW